MKVNVLLKLIDFSHNVKLIHIFMLIFFIIFSDIVATVFLSFLIFENIFFAFSVVVFKSMFGYAISLIILNKNNKILKAGLKSGNNLDKIFFSSIGLILLIFLYIVPGGLTTIFAIIFSIEKIKIFFGKKIANFFNLSIEEFYNYIHLYELNLD